MNDDPARWDRVKQLFQSALEWPVEERARFLGEVCGDDLALRREVESLFVAHQQAGNFAERPALDALVAATVALGDAAQPGPALRPGLRLGPYQVGERIGRGGMGEVYRAHDTRLDRSVAIKVLPAHVAADADLKHRFEREARTLASLSHPHICPVFDVGQQGGIDYLVMEHLEGETLAARLVRGAIPINDALEYARQIADALEAAHEKGIVHRDLTPGNIKITPTGIVKSPIPRCCRAAARCCSTLPVWGPSRASGTSPCNRWTRASARSWLPVAATRVTCRRDISSSCVAGH